MKEQFTTAELPKPWTILGRRMKPFCLGHYVILEHFKSAYVDEKTEFDWKEFIFAWQVCSQTWEEAVRMFNKGRAHKLRLSDRIRLKIGSSLGWPHIRETSDTMTRYVSEGLKDPSYRFKVRKEQGHDHGLEPWLLMKMEVLKAYNFTESEIMNMYYPKLSTYWLALRAMNPLEGYRFLRDDEAKMLRRPSVKN